MERRWCIGSSVIGNTSLSIQVEIAEFQGIWQTGNEQVMAVIVPK
jgi:hypothetical protein